MAPIEILLLNYFSVLFLTIAFGIYIKKPEKKLKSFSLWYWLSHVILALVVYKVIQLYDGFEIIYVVDLISLVLFGLSSINLKSSKANKIDQLAKTIPRLHKLSTDEFSSYLTTLFKAYGFQSVKQVKIQNDDPTNTYDYYLLARHEGSLVEIRIVNQIKILTEDHINQVASSFRDSTSQATSWMLATSAKTDNSTNIYIRNSGADIKVFDFKAISDLVYVLAPNYKPSSGIIKNTSINLIDFLLNVLSSVKTKLTLEQAHLDHSSDLKASHQFLNDVLNESDSDKPSNMELFEELHSEIESESLASKEEPKQKRSRKKKDTSDNDLQGDLKLVEKNPASDEKQPIITPSSISATDIGSNETESSNTSEIILAQKEFSDEKTLDTLSTERSVIPNNVIDETLTVEEETDPLFELNNIGSEHIITTEVDTELSAFPTVSDELTNKNQSSSPDLHNLTGEPSPLIDTDNYDFGTDQYIQIPNDQDLYENETIEEEVDPLENLDGLVEVQTVSVEAGILDDFPELQNSGSSKNDLLNFATDDNLDLFAVDGEALKHQEDNPTKTTYSSNLLSEIEETFSEVTTSINETNPTDEVDFLADVTSQSIETKPVVRIDMSDIGAALSQQTPNSTKRNTH